MNLVCLDLEGVLVPEIWINFAERTGIDALRLTTRDVADYDELMAHRLRVLDEHGLKLADIQAVIAGMGPLPGAGSSSTGSGSVRRWSSSPTPSTSSRCR